MQKIWRAAALVSYGNLTLRQQLPLESWWTHSLFCDVVMQFRQNDKGVLVAGDFVRWLHDLVGRGAQRMALWNVEQVRELNVCLSEPLCLGEDRGGFGIICYFADHAELWLERKELESAMLDEEKFPDSAYDPAPVDCYWQYHLEQVATTLPPVDWPTQRAECCHDLLEGFDDGFDEVKVRLEAFSKAISASTLAPAPSSLHRDKWNDYPIFPFSPNLCVAHGLFYFLEDLYIWFENFSHAKNESSPYSYASDKERVAMDTWFEKLCLWRGNILFALANEQRWETKTVCPVDIRAFGFVDTQGFPVSPTEQEQAVPEELSWKGKLIVLIILVALLGAVIFAFWRFPLTTGIFLIIVVGTLLGRGK